MNSKEEKLAKENLNKLMLSLSLPTIVAQIINVLYNIVDRVYLGHIDGVGSNALTGVGVALPIIVFISAFSAFVGQGGAPLSSISFGEGDKKQAEKILAQGTLLLLIFSIVLMIIFYIWQRPILMAFGASEDTLPFAMEYLSIYLIGTLSVELALGLNTYIIAQGETRTAMLSVVIGAILNIALDPVFIFTLNMGVKGAAIATIISQTVSAIWVVAFLLSKHAVLRIRFEYMAPDVKIIGRICGLGVSPFVMRATESLISIVMNRGLQNYGGDAYVGSLTIMQSTMQLLAAPIGGFTQGVAPIISFNYGARNLDRVRGTYKRMLIVTGSFDFIATLLVMIFPGFFARMFTDELTVIALVEKWMPIFMCGMLVFGLQMAIQPTFLALGRAKISIFIAVLRKIILLVPLAIILPKFIGVAGVYYAEPISDVLSATTATLLFIFNIKKILNERTK